MGLLSSSVSIIRYHVEGTVSEPIVETICNGLNRFAIRDIDNDVPEKIEGWAPFSTPYLSEFDSSKVIMGPYFVFSLRVDKKNIPPKIVKKHMEHQKQKLLALGGRDILSANEKRQLKEQVIKNLSLRIPATPNVYDIIWNYEDGWLFFFTTLKAANEKLESLFFKSFKLRLIRMFPYTAAEMLGELSHQERDRLHQLNPVQFHH
jgi:DNA recombination-dependent growth factor C